MKENRRKQIIQMLSEQHMVNSQEISRAFGVSMETVRRDMDALEKEGIIRRVHGGAILNVGSSVEPEFEHRGLANYEEKVAIGRAAAELVKNGDTIIMDIGTTTLEMARFLKGKDIVVLTNSLKIAFELMNDDHVKVIVLGGIMRDGEGTTSGHWAEEMIEEFRADKLFLGVGCLDLKIGIMDFNIEETNLRRHFIKNAEMTIALADYTKFGWKALNRVCGTGDIDVLVTDAGTDQRTIRKIREQGVTVLVAGENEKAIPEE